MGALVNEYIGRRHSASEAELQVAANMARAHERATNGSGKRIAVLEAALAEANARLARAGTPTVIIADSTAALLELLAELEGAGEVSGRAADHLRDVIGAPTVAADPADPAGAASSTAAVRLPPDAMLDGTNEHIIGAVNQHPAVAPSREPMTKIKASFHGDATRLRDGKPRWIVLGWTPDRPDSVNAWGLFGSITEARDFGREYYPRRYKVCGLHDFSSREFYYTGKTWAANEAAQARRLR
jgi:hypothetical protein